MIGIHRSSSASRTPGSPPEPGPTPKDVAATEIGRPDPGSAAAAADTCGGDAEGGEHPPPDGPPPAPSSGDSPSAERPAGEAAGRTWTVLIAALGGEGGGVLSSWLVDAASADGRLVQATSVPGVAQRTGATTYYLEIGPRQGAARGEPGLPPAGADPAADAGPSHASEGARADASRPPDASGPAPVMALLPTPGNVDLLVASELLEAGRAAQSGMITPDRTTVIASTHRSFAIAEKSAMGDGRFDDARIRRAVRELSRRHVLTDLGKVAERAGTVLSSVLLGAVAGSGALPIPRVRLRAAIERAGIAVDANLRGFDAGRRLFEHPEETDPGPPPDPAAPRVGSGPDAAAPPPRLPASFAARVEALPPPVRGFARLGVERTIDYQDERYGAAYLDRIQRLLERAVPAADAERRQEGTEEAPHGATREAARQLALWMCFEDIIRVADLKTRRSRIERVRAEVRAKPGQPVRVTEFLKPGVDEWCSLLPTWLARLILRAADRGGWRRRLNVGLHVRTTSVAGFLLLWTLARCKRLRRGTYRFREEQARIETWLDRVVQAHETGPAFALEAAKCANLVKGYGDTHERGVRNFERTMACLDACASSADPAASLRTLREAALADPEGGKLDAAASALRAGGGRSGPAARAVDQQAEIFPERSGADGKPPDGRDEP